MVMPCCACALADGDAVALPVRTALPLMVTPLADAGVSWGAPPMRARVEVMRGRGR